MTEGSAGSTQALWQLLEPGTDHAAALSALTGCDASEASAVTAAAVLLSPEAGAFLDSLPSLVRSLGIGHRTGAERCVGQVRGPIIWSETLTAWSSGLGHDDVFICMTTERDLDLPENRLIVALLTRLASSSPAIDRLRDDVMDPAARASAASRIATAKHALRDRRFAGITPKAPGAAALRSVRGRRRAAFAAASALLARLDQPLHPDDVALLTPEPWAAAHRLLLAGLAALDQMGHACPVPRVESAGLVAGRLVLRAEADGPELIVRPLRAGGEPVAVASETDVRRVLALPRPVPAGDQSPLVPQSL